MNKKLHATRYMKQAFLPTVISLLFLFSCSVKKSNIKSNELSQSEIRDSIKSILTSISDDWRFEDSSGTSKNKISIPKIDKVKIRYWTKINSEEPLNKLNITGLSLKYVDSINTMQGWDYDYKAEVEYQKKIFGLKIVSDSLLGFIGITELNAKYLIFTNGQKFTRIK